MIIFAELKSIFILIATKQHRLLLSVINRINHNNLLYFTKTPIKDTNYLLNFVYVFFINLNCSSIELSSLEGKIFY